MLGKAVPLPRGGSPPKGALQPLDSMGRNPGYGARQGVAEKQELAVLFPVGSQGFTWQPWPWCLPSPEAPFRA
jgi:hypothetical protein